MMAKVWTYFLVHSSKTLHECYGLKDFSLLKSLLPGGASSPVHEGVDLRVLTPVCAHSTMKQTRNASCGRQLRCFSVCLFVCVCVVFLFLYLYVYYSFFFSASSQMLHSQLNPTTGKVEWVMKNEDDIGEDVARSASCLYHCSVCYFIQFVVKVWYSWLWMFQKIKK